MLIRCVKKLNYNLGNSLHRGTLALIFKQNIMKDDFLETLKEQLPQVLSSENHLITKDISDSIATHFFEKGKTQGHPTWVII